ncbi:hypothetical protein [Burkholderia cepacia]|uniref:hypothetical protein n=1 Tax=Burkholderia cepacia TaxID=292 RepID=UPI002AB74BDE|nr:hypothetical protein [Burkholderia cepacia]
MATSSRLDMARSTAIDLLNAMEVEKISADIVLMRAKRVARLLGDEDAERWLDLETTGYPADISFKVLGQCQRYARKSGRISPDNKYYTQSLVEIESRVAITAEFLKGAAPRAVSGSIENFTVASATQKVYNDQIAAFGQYRSVHTREAALVAGIRAGIHAYIADALRALEFGDVAESIFDQLRGEVDDFVLYRAPRAAEKLNAIAERMAEGGPEECAEALASCRRLLLSLADDLFPAQSTDYVGSDGRSRKVGVDQYKNRLAAFIDMRVKSEGTRTLLDAELEHLCARLNAGYDKTNKGVHADVTLDEARLTIIQAYVFIGELSRLAKMDEKKDVPVIAREDVQLDGTLATIENQGEGKLAVTPASSGTPK